MLVAGTEKQTEKNTKNKKHRTHKLSYPNSASQLDMKLGLERQKQTYAI